MGGPTPCTFSMPCTRTLIPVAQRMSDDHQRGALSNSPPGLSLTPSRAATMTVEPIVRVAKNAIVYSSKVRMKEIIYSRSGRIRLVSRSVAHFASALLERDRQQPDRSRSDRARIHLKMRERRCP